MKTVNEPKKAVNAAKPSAFLDPAGGSSLSIAITSDELVKGISDMVGAMRVLHTSRLSRRALVALLHDESKVSKKTINFILDHLQSLEKPWLKP